MTEASGYKGVRPSPIRGRDTHSKVLKASRFGPAALAVLAVALGVAGCGSASQEAAPTESPEVIATATTPAAPGCTVLVDAAGETSDATQSALQAALDGAEPGASVCVAGGSFEERLSVSRSGEEAAPIVIKGMDAVVVGFDIEGDHVEVAGFTVSGGRSGEPGIAVGGAQVAVVDNVIRDPGGHGVACERDTPCDDVLIARNTITGADGSGVVVYGRGATIEDNDISGSVQREASDADGVRFFGSGHLIRRNFVHDISDEGYPEGDAPHTDCFQTFDESDTPTRDVTLAANVCRNVDHQCLIATATASREAGDIGRSSTIRFVNNICDTNGSQAVLVSEFPDVLVAHNLFLQGVEFQAVAAIEGSTDLQLLNNIVLGTYAPYWLAEDSRDGFVSDHNLQYDPELGEPLSSWIEPSGQWGVNPGIVGLRVDASGVAYSVAPDSPLIDAGTPVDGVSTDVIGNPRFADGDGDGEPQPDIGPLEIQAGAGG